jgi:Reverse transcriptase (RNA-dependent DNA polymerase)
MVNARLTWFLESNGVLTELQSGFRKGHSTTDQLVGLESFVREAFLRGEHAVAVFFGLEKAYDTTWKHGILQDLENSGLKGRLPIFIANFLANRKFLVRAGSHLSTKPNQTVHPSEVDKLVAISRQWVTAVEYCGCKCTWP